MNLPSPHSKKLIIGVGNEQCGDDGVGLLVARRLRARQLPDVAVLECRSDPTRLIDSWSGADRVCVVDAVFGGAAPGKVFRFDALKRLPARVGLRASTHGLGIAETIELARSLGQLPAELLVYGIQGAQFEIGAPITPQVRQAAEQVIAAIVQDCERETDHKPHDVGRVSLEARK